MTPKANVTESHVQINGLAAANLNTKITINPPELGEFDSFVQLNNFNENIYKLIRKPKVIKISGVSKSTLHLRINDGLMPPPISIGERAVAYVEHEVLAVIAAQIKGHSDDEIRSLVVELVAQRQNLFSGVHL